jgi:3-hydroxyisobutyrate dehydrogenase-like beta-hydroxyacid dehydrogenase
MARKALKKKRSKGRVGVVGLGIMGGAFAKNLAAAGWQVAGFDIDPAQCRKAARTGVEIAANSSALAQSVPVIITSLAEPQALHDTVRAITMTNGPRRVIVETSTFSLEDKQQAERALRAAGHIMLDCPISGTGAQAQTKDIVIYASGERAAIRRLAPLFAGFSRAAHDLGAFGNGSRMKYVANLLVAIHNVSTAEAMVLGIKAGLDPEQILRVISSGVGNSRIFELRGPMIARNHYDPATMKLSVWQKDMALIGAFAKGVGSPTPLFDLTGPLYDRAVAAGHGGQDTAAVATVLEQMAGLARAGKSRSKRRKTL